MLHRVPRSSVHDRKTIDQSSNCEERSDLAARFPPGDSRKSRSTKSGRLRVSVQWPYKIQWTTTKLKHLYTSHRSLGNGPFHKIPSQHEQQTNRDCLLRVRKSLVKDPIAPLGPRECTNSMCVYSALSKAGIQRKDTKIQQNIEEINFK